jgi:hypothetical protein
MLNFWSRNILAWLGLFVLAFANGALREAGLKSVLSIQEPLAHQLSCVTGVVLWTTFVWFVWNKLRILDFSKAIKVGVVWFLATFLFETFILNRRLSWTQILNTYNVFEGEFWGLALVWIGFLPVMLLKLKRNTNN